MKLDAKTVAALNLGDKPDVVYWDDVLPRFGYRLRLSHDGKRVLRSWLVQYRRSGASRRITIGSAEVFKPEQARAEARKILARVDLGEDPAGDRQARHAKDKLSLRSQVDAYLALAATEVRSSTLRDVTRYLTGPYFKPLHGMPVDKVTKADVASRLNAIRRDHGNVVAAASRAKLSAFFVWALQDGIVEHNPVVGTRKLAGNKPSDRVLSDSEMVRLWNACEDDMPQHYGPVIRLVILTGCRRAEIGGMRWSEFDDPDNPTTWTLPAARAKNGHKHTLPLMPMACNIIKGVPHMVNRDQLFGGRSDAGFVAWDLGKRALDALSRVSNWTPHDIRRSVATKMADIGIQPHIIEQILNHQSGHKSGPAGIYNRSSYEHEVRAALAMWEDHLRTLLAGGERKVVPYAPHAVT